MKRFIGGKSIHQAYSRFSLHWPNVIPIFDYAKEGTKTYDTSKKTFHQIRKDIEWLNTQPLHWSYAIKMSSFVHFNPNACLSFLQGTSKGALFLDAEDQDIRMDEQMYYPSLLKTQSESVEPIRVYKTYQMYRMDAFQELMEDIHQYPRLGIKLVRGAYLHRDKSKNILFNTIDKTHSNYHKAMHYLASPELHQQHDLSIVIATHNRISIDLFQHYVYKYPFLKNKMAMAQLMGMRDDLIQEFHKNDIRVYKYVPYGNFIETYPYLIRRWFENIKIIQHAL